MTEPTRSERRLEVASTLLLALAPVATVWAAYQSRQSTRHKSEATSDAMQRESRPGSRRNGS
jgi:uncharacterized membrane protein YqjE